MMVGSAPAGEPSLARETLKDFAQRRTHRCPLLAVLVSHMANKTPARVQRPTSTPLGGREDPRTPLVRAREVWAHLTSLPGPSHACPRVRASLRICAMHRLVVVAKARSRRSYPYPCWVGARHPRGRQTPDRRTTQHLQCRLAAGRQVADRSPTQHLQCRLPTEANRSALGHRTTASTQSIAATVRPRRPVPPTASPLHDDCAVLVPSTRVRGVTVVIAIVFVRRSRRPGRRTSTVHALELRRRVLRDRMSQTRRRGLHWQVRGRIRHMRRPTTGTAAPPRRRRARVGSACPLRSHDHR